MSHTFAEKFERQLTNALNVQSINFADIAYFYTKFCNFFQYCTIIHEEELQLLARCSAIYIDCIDNYIKSVAVNKEDIQMILYYCDVVIKKIYKLSLLNGIGDEYLPRLLLPIFDKVTAATSKIWFVKGLLINFNRILNCTKQEVRHTVAASHKLYLYKLIDALCSCGDYEYQVTLMRTIFLLCSENQLFECAWDLFPESKSFEIALCNIQRNKFYYDIRLLLNMVNNKYRSVFSINCKYVFMDCFHLNLSQCPAESHFWVDFNIGSNTLSISCNAYLSHTMSKISSGTWKPLIINVADVSSISQFKLFMEDSSAPQGSVIIFNLTGDCMAVYPSLHETGQAKQLQIVILNCAELQQLLHNVLPTMFGEKFKTQQQSPQNAAVYVAMKLNKNVKLGTGDFSSNKRQMKKTTQEKVKQKNESPIKLAPKNKSKVISGKLHHKFKIKKPFTRKMVCKVKSNLALIKETVLCLLTNKKQSINSNNAAELTSHTNKEIFPPNVNNDNNITSPNSTVQKQDELVDKQHLSISSEVFTTLQSPIKNDNITTEAILPQYQSNKRTQGEITLVQENDNNVLKQCRQVDLEIEAVCNVTDLSLTYGDKQNVNIVNMLQNQQGSTSRGRKLYDISLLQLDPAPAVRKQKVREKLNNKLQCTNHQQIDANISSPECTVSHVEVVTTALIEPVPKENIPRSKQPIRTIRLATKKKSSATIIPIDFDAIEIVPLSTSSKQCVPKTKQINLPKTLLELQERQVDKENSPNCNQAVKTSIVKKTSKQRTRATTKRKSALRIKKQRKPKKIVEIANSQNNANESYNFSSLTKQLEQRMLASKSSKDLNQSRSTCLVQKRRVPHRNCKNKISYSQCGIDAVVREAVHDGYESLHSDDGYGFTTAVKSTKPKSSKIRCMYKTGHKPEGQQFTKQESSSSSPLPDLDIEMERSTKYKYILETLTTDTDSLQQETGTEYPKLQKINIISNITVQNEAETKSNSDASTVVILQPDTLETIPNFNHKIKSIVAEENLVLPPLSQIPEENELVNQDYSMEVNNKLYLSQIPEVTETSNLMGISNITEFENLSSPPNRNVAATNEQIMSWVATGLPRDSSEVLRRHAQINLRGWADVTKIYLDSLRGPVNPADLHVYNTLGALDEVLYKHFKKN